MPSGAACAGEAVAAEGGVVTAEGAGVVDAAAAPALIHALEDKSDGVRVGSVEALAKLPPETPGTMLDAPIAKPAAYSPR